MLPQFILFVSMLSKLAAAVHLPSNSSVLRLPNHTNPSSDPCASQETSYTGHWPSGITVADVFDLFYLYLDIAEYGNEVNPARAKSVLRALKAIKLQIEYEEDPSPWHVSPEAFSYGWVSVKFSDWVDDWRNLQLQLDVVDAICMLVRDHGPREIKLAELIFSDHTMGNVELEFRQRNIH
ncbi:MAG: hypothetical protein L6R38_005872 [Xanthoria sp. 2 TBL-2021]|nr:MAG: hypothetical protein L6R38_005872 [Xanthoria sp. 2 TBL-2021]